MNDQSNTNGSGWDSSILEREIVISRVVKADRESTFRAWTNPTQIVQWFGPEGFKIETHEININEGGLWRFDMIGPDGSRYSNRMEFLRIVEPTSIEVLHGSDVDNDPDAFRMLVTFDEQNNGKTVVTLRQIHASSERRTTVIGFGAVELGAQTLKKLAKFAEGVL